MIKKYIGLYTYLHIKNVERPIRMGHNTWKSMGEVICVVRR